MDLEGIVSKRKGSRYMSGRSPAGSRARIGRAGQCDGTAHASIASPGARPELDGLHIAPSTINDRDFVDFIRMSLTSFCAAESFQALAFSALSNPITMKRFGAVPSSAVIFSLRITN